MFAHNNFWAAHRASWFSTFFEMFNFFANCCLLAPDCWWVSASVGIDDVWVRAGWWWRMSASVSPAQTVTDIDTLLLTSRQPHKIFQTMLTKIFRQRLAYNLPWQMSLPCLVKLSWKLWWKLGLQDNFISTPSNASGKKTLQGFPTSDLLTLFVTLSLYYNCTPKWNFSKLK